MPADLFSIPYAISATPEATECSKAGARKAAESVGRQSLELLALYKQHGPLTDREAADLMRIERTTVNARRSQLRRLGLVTLVDTVLGTCGVRNTRWGCA